VFDRPRSGTLSVFAGDKIGRNEVIHWTGFDASHFPKAAKANARLIAAAPDMLAALVNAMAAADDDLKERRSHREDDCAKAYAMCAAAVAKATGK
jgi:hypothetical protein